jgi:hypothetical protein
MQTFSTATGFVVVRSLPKILKYSAVFSLYLCESFLE